MATLDSTAEDFYTEPQVSGSRRNDRINDDWQYLDKPNLPNKPTIDQKFNLRYQQTGLNQIKVTKPQKDSETKDKYGNPVQNYRVKVDNEMTLSNPTPLQNIGTVSVTDRLQRRAYKKKALGISRMVRSFYIAQWPVFQLPFAILSMIGLGLAAGGGAISSSISNSDNIFMKAIDFTVNILVDGVSTLIGFNVGDLAIGLFAVPFAVLIGMHIFMVLFISLAYLINGIKPLSGRAVGAKWGFLALSFIGYCIPVLNLFPWTLFWTTTIAKYPR